MTKPPRWDPPQLIPRDAFLVRHWHYEPGDHVTFLAPTRCGKTTLAFQLLDATASEKLPAVVLVMKPRDAVVSRYAKALDLRRVRSWPPIVNPLRKPRGWVLWPRHVYDVDQDDRTLHKEFRAAILDSYKRGNRILFGDEVYGIATELKLSRELIMVWSRGGSMGCGLWSATQKPSHVPLWAYSQPRHIFIHYDPDKRARDRFGEIGGVDPDYVRSVVMGLRRHQWLYISRDGAPDGGPAMCIVDK